MNLKRSGVLGILAVLLLSLNSASAQFTTVFNLPPDPDFGDFVTIGSDTQVNVYEGGYIGRYFSAGSATGLNSNIEVNIFGGEIDSYMDAYNGATLNIHGGLVEGSLNAYSGSTINITGGDVDYYFTVREGAVANISGGIVHPSASIHQGGLVNVSGGWVRSIAVSGVLDISGGEFGAIEARETGLVTMSHGRISSLDTNTGSSVEFFGGEFMLDGVAVSGQVNIAPGSVLTGTLEDGSVLIFSSIKGNDIADGTLTLTDTTVPSSDPSVFNVPTDSAPNGLRAGQTLNLADGGEIGRQFGAVQSTLNISGGSIDVGLTAYQSQIDVSGGTIARATFMDSDVNFGGGTSGSIYLIQNTTATMTGGFIESLNVEAGNVVNINQEPLGDDSLPMTEFLNVQEDGVANISAGVHEFVYVEGSVHISGGNTSYLRNRNNAVVSGGGIGYLDSRLNSNTELRGGYFMLDGVPVSGLTDIPTNSILTGVLEDGTAFIVTGLADHVNRHFTDRVENGTLNLVNTSVAKINENVIDVFDYSTVNSIRDGQVLNLHEGGELHANFTVVGATLNMSGGSIGEKFEIMDGVLNMSGGTIERGMFAFEGARINLSGGTIEGLWLWEGAEFHIIGSRFFYDGVEITDTLTIGEMTEYQGYGRDFTVEYLDGSTFTFPFDVGIFIEDPYFFHPDATVYLTRSVAVPEPATATALVVLFAVFAFGFDRRRTLEHVLASKGKSPLNRKQS